MAQWCRLICIMSTLLLGVLVTMYIIRNASSDSMEGCNYLVEHRCFQGEASVCLTSKCPKSVVGGPLFKKAMLDAHTQIRKKPSSNGSYGGDMNLLTWDNQLENAALMWAHKLCSEHKVAHDENKCRQVSQYNSVGQNVIVKISKHSINDSCMAIQAVDAWYMERRNTSEKYMFPFKWIAAAGHYTALVWSRSYRIGCGLVRRTDTLSLVTKTFVVCNYAPSGNIRGGKYNVFKPSNEVATSCMPGTAKGDSGLCEVIDENKYRAHVSLSYVPPR